MASADDESRAEQNNQIIPPRRHPDRTNKPKRCSCCGHHLKPPLTHLDELMCHYSQNNEMAIISFESLLAQVQDQILQYVRRRFVPLHDAEDIVQDVAARVARNGKDYNHSSPIISWFYEIARTMTIDYLRRNGRSLPHSFEDQGGNEDEDTQFGRHLAASDDKYNPYKQAILNEDKQWLSTRASAYY